MKVQLVNVTPKVAENYLKRNTNNRKLDDRKVSFYVGQMNRKEWKENGESIVFDYNGVLKDGQHRLAAIIKSGNAYKIPIVEGVHPDVMSTIDTGKNRSLGDILKLNGFKQYCLIASVSTKIMVKTLGKINTSSTKRNSPSSISNSAGLDYCIENKEKIYRLIDESIKINSKSPYNILSTTYIAYYLYLLGGYEFTDTHVDFIKHVLGIRTKEGNAAMWLHKKLYNSKINKDPLNQKWIEACIIKAWNLFAEGDPAVKYLQFDVTQPLPKVSTL